MNLQIDYLRTFIALAEAKNFTKTGVQVNLSQSAVSMQIKRLENEVGKKLFDRIGKTVKLTSEGSIFIRYAMRIVREHDEAVAALSKPNLEGFIRFGSPEHYTAGGLPELLARFAIAPIIKSNVSSDIESLSLSELLAMASKEDRDAFENQWLGYTETYGHPELLREIAKTYDTVDPSDSICFAGAEKRGFIFSAMKYTGRWNAILPSGYPRLRMCMKKGFPSMSCPRLTAFPACASDGL